jgi:hypothetical protein
MMSGEQPRKGLRDKTEPQQTRNQEEPAAEEDHRRRIGGVLTCARSRAPEWSASVGSASSPTSQSTLALLNAANRRSCSLNAKSADTVRDHLLGIS